MEEADADKTGTYYIPYQPVKREDSLTTKLRLVFDTSSKTTKGKSLNDKQLTGPITQETILEIIIIKFTGK